MKKITGVLTGAVLLLAACQQEPDDLLNQARNCQVENIIYYDGGGNVYDSAVFTYDLQGRVTRWTGNDGYWDYQYTGNHIVGRRYYENGAMLFVDSIWYDGANRITAYDMRDYSGWRGDTAHTRLIFQYQNNRLDRVLNIDYYTVAGVPVQDTFPSRYYWTAGENIDKIVFTDMFDQPVDSISFQYDTHPNYFKVVHPHYFLFDSQFQLFAGFEPHLAFYYSKNNVINSNSYGTFDNPIVYGHDSTNKITSLNKGSDPGLRFTYRCP